MSRERVVAAVLATSLAGACAGPSRTDEDYASKAANTAEAVVSAVESARLAVRAADEERGFANYLTRLLVEAEEDANGALEALDKVNPPSERADAMHDRLDEIVTPVLDVLRDLRLAVRRGHLADLPHIATPLADLSERLNDFAEHPR